MKKILTDVHTHSKFSIDGISELTDMLSSAYALGIEDYGIAEHFEYSGGDSLYGTDEKSYFPTARRLQTEYVGKMRVLVGAEFGFQENPTFYRLAQALIERYRPDFVVNSIHRVGFDDLDANGKPMSKEEIYKNYLLQVLRSLDAPFHYDIVGHIGYCSRYARYPDRNMYYVDYKDELDRIFKKIIEKDKILEVNGKFAPPRFDGDLPIDFVPQADVLEGYYRLGGRKISYASDAHGVTAIMQGRIGIVDVLREIGFTYLTVPYTGKRIGVEL